MRTMMTPPERPEPPPEPQKEEPVRRATGEAAIAGGLVVVCNRLGLADFTLEEALMIVLAVFALANEVARMHVWAKPKS